MKDLLRTYLFRLKKTKAIWIIRIVRIGLVLLATIGIGSRNVKTINAYQRQGSYLHRILIGSSLCYFSISSSQPTGATIPSGTGA